MMSSLVEIRYKQRGAAAGASSSNDEGVLLAVESGEPVDRVTQSCREEVNALYGAHEGFLRLLMPNGIVVLIPHDHLNITTTPPHEASAYIYLFTPPVKAENVDPPPAVAAVPRANEARQAVLAKFKTQVPVIPSHGSGNFAAVILHIFSD